MLRAILTTKESNQLDVNPTILLLANLTPIHVHILVDYVPMIYPLLEAFEVDLIVAVTYF
jgi:hypothetical protein